MLFFLFSGLLWLAPLISEPMGVLFWRGGAYSDLLISHWSNAVLVRQSLADWGQIPLWNPMILSGAPFAADPLSGLYYLPNWLAIAINPGLAFNLLAWLHIAWGGFGMWRLTRTLGIGSGPAIVAGIAFAGMPKLIGHLGLGHVSLVFAVYWTPWVLLAFENAIRELHGRRFAAAALAGATLGLVFLIDPRWYPPAALLAGAYVVWRFAHSHRANKAGSLEDRALVKSKWLRAGSSLSISALMSLAIAAILAIPLGEFISLSTRANLSLAQSAELRLPPAYLLNAMAPEYAGWPEWQVYAGVIVLFLALTTMASRASGRWFWVGVVLISFIFALGDLTPLYGMASAVVPGFNQLRVPPRSLFLSGFSLAILAGMGLDQILDGKARPRDLRILGAVLVALILVLAAGFWLRDQAVLRTASYIVSAALIGLSVLWAGISVRKPLRWSILGWCLLIVFDLSLANLTTIEVRPGPTMEVARLSQGAIDSRMFSPSYSLSQPAAAISGLELADGINPLQLASYSAYMSRAAGYVEERYSVTLPPFPTGDPVVEWGFKPDLELMGNVAVSQIVSAYPISDSNLVLESEQEGRFYYSNPLAKPLAWIDGGGHVELLERTPNRITVEATGPGTLVSTEIAYPGWEVEIDGFSAPMATYQGLLRAVELDAGEHRVQFIFRSNSISAGALITLLGLIVLVSLWFRR